MNLMNFGKRMIKALWKPSRSPKKEIEKHRPQVIGGSLGGDEGAVRIESGDATQPGKKAGMGRSVISGHEQRLADPDPLGKMLATCVGGKGNNHDLLMNLRA
jgi:hypothetical protein